MSSQIRYGKRLSYTIRIHDSCCCRVGGEISSSIVKPQPPSVYDYRDYRAFLRDWWEHRKGIDRRLSLRSFARRAGYESFSLYRNIASGLRNLTPRYLPGFQKALGLNEREQEFFALLVDFTHSRDPRRTTDLLGSHEAQPSAGSAPVG